jgi:hypothetical protein
MKRHFRVCILILLLTATNEQAGDWIVLPRHPVPTLFQSSLADLYISELIDFVTNEKVRSKIDEFMKERLLHGEFESKFYLDLNHENQDGFSITGFTTADASGLMKVLVPMALRHEIRERNLFATELIKQSKTAGELVRKVDVQFMLIPKRDLNRISELCNWAVAAQKVPAISEAAGEFLSAPTVNMFVHAANGWHCRLSDTSDVHSKRFFGLAIALYQCIANGAAHVLSENLNALKIDEISGFYKSMVKLDATDKRCRTRFHLPNADVSESLGIPLDLFEEYLRKGFEKSQGCSLWLEEVVGK